MGITCAPGLEVGSTLRGSQDREGGGGERDQEAGAGLASWKAQHSQAKVHLLQEECPPPGLLTELSALGNQAGSTTPILSCKTPGKCWLASASAGADCGQRVCRE